MHEVDAPALVRQGQNRSNRQAFLLVEPLGLLPVDHDPLPTQQDVQTAIAEPATLIGQLAQLLSQIGVIVPGGTVTHALAIGIDHTARSPCAHPMAGMEMSHSFPNGGGRQN